MKRKTKKISKIKVLPKRKAPRRKIYRKNPNLTQIKKGQIVYFGNEPLRVDKVSLNNIEAGGRIIPLYSPNLSISPPKNNSFLSINDTKYYLKNAPVFRKIYLYEYPLPTGFGKIINILRKQAGWTTDVPNQTNLTLVIYVITFLDSNKKEIPNKYLYAIEVLNKYDTVLFKIVNPEGIRYSSNFDATNAALAIFRSRTGINIPFNNLPLVKHDIIRLDDDRYDS